MDINKTLKNIKHIDEYKHVTEEIINAGNIKVQFNITTILTLEKIKSLETEYVMKYNKNGAACIVFEKILNFPPSKTWGVLASNLVNLLQYWMECIQKNGIDTIHWWHFLKRLLKFIKKIHNKEPKIPEILVELTSQHLFNMASQENLSITKRHEILYCLNMFCAGSSREMRFALRNKLGDCFTKLASLLARCGYLPCQYVSLEALVRWLVPRHDQTLRANSAARWFPQDLCPASATKIFLETSWMKFFQDARNFLNALNEANGLVTSVLCKRLYIGNVLMISGAENQQTWLDINTDGRCLSVLLDPQALETFGVLDNRTYEALIISEDYTNSAELRRESRELQICVTSSRPPRVQPSDVVVGEESDVTIVISSKVDLNKLDAALRNVFKKKYHLFMDLNTELSMLSPSPPTSFLRRIPPNSEEDTRFSHPAEMKRKSRSGYVLKRRGVQEVKSPSTGSTTSLAHLGDKLAALPHFKYDKKLLSVCALPQLSDVTEISEREVDSCCTASTLKIRGNSGGRNFKVVTKRSVPPGENKTESDTIRVTLQNENLNIESRSPINIRNDTTNSLLAATMGSNDDCDTITNVEQLTKNNDMDNDNIVEMLIKEALIPKRVVEPNITTKNDKKTQDNEENCEAIENTPTTHKDIPKKKRRAKPTKKNCTVISKSTTEEESNTEVINATPVPTYSTKKQPKESIDAQEIENFFAQHFAEAKSGQIVVSPTLARKINDSENSSTFDENYLTIQELKSHLNIDNELLKFNDVDIVECLNDMIDRVCSNLEKCTAYLDGEDGDSQSKKQTSIVKEDENTNIPKTKRKVKLPNKPKIAKLYPKKVIPKKSKIKGKVTKKMSTILERNDENIQDIENDEAAKVDIEQNKKGSPTADLETSTRKKRKLYSPRDDLNKQKKESQLSDSDDDIPLAIAKQIDPKPQGVIKTPNTTSYYKELEKERLQSTRKRQLRKCRINALEPPSPRTLKNDTVFDKLLASQDCEKVTLANKNTLQSDVYNYTSDSEDEDFIKKKIDIRNRISGKGKVKPTMKTNKPQRRNTRSSNLEKNNQNNKNVKRNTSKKITKKSNSNTKSIDNECMTDLIDERMRHASVDNLNSSLTIEKPKTVKSTEVELTLHDHPQMEMITDFQEAKILEKQETSKNTKKSNSLKSKQNKNTKNRFRQLQSEMEQASSTASPLPGLIIEAESHKKDGNDSFTGATILQKLKEVCKSDHDVIDEPCNTQDMLLHDIHNDDPSHNISVHVPEDISNKEYKFNISSKSKHKTTKQKTKNELDDKLTKGKHTNKIIEISEALYIKSDCSIKSYGITAHGDIEENPPNTDMIRKSMQPREIEDLDLSMKDYFVNLNQEIISSNFKDQQEANIDNINDDAIISIINKNVNSPVVSIERLSFDKISNWIPSPKATTSYNFTECVTHKPKINKSVSSNRRRRSKGDSSLKKLTDNSKNLKQMPKNNANRNKQVKDSLVEVKSACVNVPRLSPEALDKWLPIPKDKTYCDESPSLKKAKTGFQLVFNTSESKKNKILKLPCLETEETTKTIPTKSPTKITILNETLNNNKKASDTPQSSKQNKTKISSTPKIPFVKIVKLSDSGSECKFRDKTTSPKILRRNNKTVITPIMNFEDYIAQNKDNSSVASKFMIPKCRSKSSISENTLLDIESRHSPKPVVNLGSQNSRYFLRSKILNDSASQDAMQVDLMSDDNCKNTMKRKSSPLRSLSKKRRLEDNDGTTIETIPSISSVNNWLKKNDQSRSQDIDTDLSYRDILQNIMEKLDTTLEEINQNTSKKFANLFVETQQQLSTRREQEVEMFKSVGSGIVLDVISIIEEKVDELTKRSQEMDIAFKEELKRKSLELLREDCKQKRSLVSLLRDDVKAFINNIDKNRSS